MMCGHRLAIGCVMVLFIGQVASSAVEIHTPHFSVTVKNGSVVDLTNAMGSRLVLSQDQVNGAGIHRLAGDGWATRSTVLEPWGEHGRAVEECAGFAEMNGARVKATYALEEASGDLVITQSAESPEKGVWGVEWCVAYVPLDMNILVPGNSGLRLTRTSPGGTQMFDYPMTWEAQLVIVEGAGRGFYVWAEDAKGVFKRLTVERSTKGWRLGFITMPMAPFEDRSTCESVRWHLNVYEGDWRVPAKRYRDWAEGAFQPTRIEKQTPSWVREIRCCVIMGLDLKMLDALPSRIDPKQTLLYLFDWRTAGYDRDYPTYDQPYDTLDPFVQRAHDLGFRVMLHVNYFGCDPLNPLYAQFEPYQIRSPWGAHEKEWWLWTRADPIIKFAYINPAHKPWRDLLVARFTALCQTHHIDALHLDQTLCLYNDYNGLIDGMSMIDGSIALHRELREALPEVALSGEGLDEVTYRYEAFAQRHVWGMNHADGTYSMPWLRAAHPISSYVLRPYTTIYGYLGCAPPTDGPLYAAWNEAYMHFGVIPTLKPDLAQLANPTGFSRQFFDETACWLKHRVDIDMDAPWPPEVAFPFRAADGTSAVRTTDRRLVYGDNVISQTITGMSEVKAGGSISGWCAYDDEYIRGLDPACWYPLSSAPRDPTALHVVSSFPEGFTVKAVAVRDSSAFIRTKAASNFDIRLAERLPEAVCGSRPFNGQAAEAEGELHAPDGAAFSGNGDAIYAHPPFLVAGSGTAYARFTLTLPPDTLRFISDVALDAGAVGNAKSDGVTFSVEVKCGEHNGHAELHNATDEHRVGRGRPEEGQGRCHIFTGGHFYSEDSIPCRLHGLHQVTNLDGGRTGYRRQPRVRARARQTLSRKRRRVESRREAPGMMYQALSGKRVKEHE